MVQNSFLRPRLDAPLTGTRLLYAHLQFRLQKCQKPVKYFITFLSVITQKSVICYKSQFNMRFIRTFSS